MPANVGATPRETKTAAIQPTHEDTGAKAAAGMALRLTPGPESQRNHARHRLPGVVVVADTLIEFVVGTLHVLAGLAVRLLTNGPTAGPTGRTTVARSRRAS
jgi:hypothetical protein